MGQTRTVVRIQDIRTCIGWDIDPSGQWVMARFGVVPIYRGTECTTIVSVVM